MGLILGSWFGTWGFALDQQTHRLGDGEKAAVSLGLKEESGDPPSHPLPGPGRAEGQGYGWTGREASRGFWTFPGTGRGLARHDLGGAEVWRGQEALPEPDVTCDARVQGPEGLGTSPRTCSRGCRGRGGLTNSVLLLEAAWFLSCCRADEWLGSDGQGPRQTCSPGLNPAEEQVPSGPRRSPRQPAIPVNSTDSQVGGAAPAGGVSPVSWAPTPTPP